MNTAISAVQNWLFSEFASRLAAAFEVKTGDRPTVERTDTADVTFSGAPQWRQPFSGVQGAIWVVAAGPVEEDPSKPRSEYLEILNQALAGTAQTMSERLSREVVSHGGEESASNSNETVWSSIHVRLGALAATFCVGLESALVNEFVKPPTLDLEAPPEKASTFDLLFDVELPVSVSFGRAQVALKDVLKLTTGSIVELNRAIGDPVEVIVNNCVIARGEVVVVEGNFGVRIQQVISRQERLRTLS